MYGPVLEKREWGLQSRTVPALPIAAYYYNDGHGVDNEIPEESRILDSKEGQQGNVKFRYMYHLWCRFKECEDPKVTDDRQ
jgi:hypothetical protein